MSSYTNKDIMQTLGRIEQKVDDVTELAKKTNGRVTTIENWKNALEAVENYKKSNQLPSPPVATTKEGNVIVTPPASYWNSREKLYGALAGLAVAVATVLTVIFGVNK